MILPIMKIQYLFINVTLLFEISRPHVHHTYRLEQDIDEHFATMNFALGEQVKGARLYAMNKGDQRHCRETLKNLRKDINLGRYCWWAQGETIQSSKTKVGAKPFPSVQVGIDEMNKTFQQCLEEYKGHKQKLQATYDEVRAAELAQRRQDKSAMRQEKGATIVKRKGKSTIVRPSGSSRSSTSSDQQVVEAEEVDEEWDSMGDDDFDVGNPMDMDEEEDEDALPEGKLQLQKIRANQAKQKKKAEALIQQEEDQRQADIAQAALVKNVKESLTTRLLFNGQCYQKFLATQKRLSTGKVPTVFVHKSMLPVSCLTMYMLGYGRPNHPRSTLRERLLE